MSGIKIRCTIRSYQDRRQLTNPYFSALPLNPRVPACVLNHAPVCRRWDLHLSQSKTRRGFEMVKPCETRHTTCDSYCQVYVAMLRQSARPCGVWTVWTKPSLCRLLLYSTSPLRVTPGTFRVALPCGGTRSECVCSSVLQPDPAFCAVACFAYPKFVTWLVFDRFLLPASSSRMLLAWWALEGLPSSLVLSILEHYLPR